MERRLTFLMALTLLCASTVGLSACFDDLFSQESSSPASHESQAALDDAEEELEEDDSPEEQLPPYSTLKQLPFQTIEWDSPDGFRLKAKLYDHWQNELDKQEVDLEDCEEPDEMTGECPFPVPPQGKQVQPLILLHGLNQQGSSWKQFIVRLVNKGYGVLAVDLRGHGDSAQLSAGGYESWRRFKPSTWEHLHGDMDRLFRYLRNQSKKQHPQLKPGSVSLIGVGLGANLALETAGRHIEDVRAVVALAPGLNYKGLEPAIPMLEFKKPILFAASQADDYSFDSTEKLYAIAQGPKTIRLYQDIGIGLDMLAYHPPLTDFVIQWLGKH